MHHLCISQPVSINWICARRLWGVEIPCALPLAPEAMREDTNPSVGMRVWWECIAPVQALHHLVHGARSRSTCQPNQCRFERLSPLEGGMECEHTNPAHHLVGEGVPLGFSFESPLHCVFFSNPGPRPGHWRWRGRSCYGQVPQQTMLRPRSSTPLSLLKVRLGVVRVGEDENMKMVFVDVTRGR